MLLDGNSRHARKAATGGSGLLELHHMTYALVWEERGSGGALLGIFVSFEDVDVAGQSLNCTDFRVRVPVKAERGPKEVPFYLYCWYVRSFYS